MRRGPYKDRQELFDKARILRLQGRGYRTIGNEIGISWRTVKGWVFDIEVDPDHARRARLMAATESRIPVEQMKNRRDIRRRLVEERGHRCEGCRRTKWRGEPIPLDLHHGNGKSNKPEDLFLYCPNCHSQTEGWRGRSRNNKV